MNWYRMLVLAWVVTMGSCGVFGGEKEQEEEKVETSSAPKLVGRIASVNGEQRFVLIEGYGSWRLGEGLLLSSFGGSNERSASLMVSGERMGRFTAADWKSGDLEVGDSVYARPVQAIVDSSDEPNLGKPMANSGQSNENFQKKADGTD